MKPPDDALAMARTALACLDLTSLGDADTAADIEALCGRAHGRFGHTAAVCVWPRFAALARSRLPTDIAVAAVANFPDGGSEIQRALRDTGEIVDAGAQEVDVVMPYRELAAAPALLAAVRRACEGLRLKVILETGELQDAALIGRACRIALDAGADFLKTSTGKTPTGATPAAAEAMLRCIVARPAARARAGLKVSGGIRRVPDALPYIALCRSHLGDAALRPQRLRIGASSLLDDIEHQFGGSAAPPAAQDGY
jgi:deoxyribose-phosphate aldolase